MEINLTSIIVALIAAAVSVIGYREAKRGRKDTNVQQQATNILQAEKQELDTLRLVIENERAEADRAMIARDIARQEADKERAYRLQVETDLRTEADTERSRRVECETSLRLAEEQHRRATKRYSEELSTLASLVRDEVLLEAGRTQLAIELAENDPPSPP